MNIIWTPKATDSFDQITDYIEEKFSQKEVDAFITDVYSIVANIKSFPKMYPQSERLKKVRKATVSAQCSLFYSVSKTTVTLLLFWDNRKDPSTLSI